MARYRRVSLMEREELSRMLAARSSPRAIGQALSRAPSTLSRELARHRNSTQQDAVEPRVERLAWSVWFIWSIWLIWYVLFIWLIRFIWLVSFNQKTRQTKQTR